MKSSAYYFHIKTKILADFQICISVTLRYSNFCPEFFSRVGIWVDKKETVNFKIYDVIYWKTNHSNRHIALYLKK